MKRYRKFAAIMLLAALMIGILAESSEVMAVNKSKYRPYIKERSVALTEGKSTKLTIKHAEEYKVKYKSADKSIMKVSKTGKITGVKMGLTELCVTFSVAGVGSIDYTIPVGVWKKPFSEITQTRTIEPGMQCQLWLSSIQKAGRRTNVEITISTDSEDENLKLHVYGLEENPEIKYHPGCPMMKLFVEADKGYINKRIKEKKTGGELFLQTPKKAAWVINNSDAPVEVTFTVKTANDSKDLKWIELKDVKAGK